jgi:hypothetical protein
MGMPFGKGNTDSQNDEPGAFDLDSEIKKYEALKAAAQAKGASAEAKAQMPTTPLNYKDLHSFKDDKSKEQEKLMKLIAGVSKGNNIAALVYIQDGVRIIDRFETFRVVRNPDLLLGWAIFKLPKGYVDTGDNLDPIGQMFKRKKIQRLFNPKLAEFIGGRGWLAYFDATNYQQIPPTQDKDMINLVQKMNAELEATMQGLIVANTESERKKKKESWLAKYGVQIMMIITIFILGLAIFQLGGDIAKLQTGVASLQGALNKFNIANATIKAVTGSNGIA